MLEKMGQSKWSTMAGLVVQMLGERPRTPFDLVVMDGSTIAGGVEEAAEDGVRLGGWGFWGGHGRKSEAPIICMYMYLYIKHMDFR